MIDWSAYAQNAKLRAVIDPADAPGHKNRYIDLLHHKVLTGAFGGRLRGKRVLDLGCGIGRFYDLLKSEGAGHIIGLDFCAGMLKRYPGVSVAASASKIPFPDGYFDAVLSVWTLQYLDPTQLGEAILEISRVLAPGGSVYLIEQMSYYEHDGAFPRLPGVYVWGFSTMKIPTRNVRPIMRDSDKLVGAIRHGLVPECLFGPVSSAHLFVNRGLTIPENGYLDVFLQFGG